MKIRTFTYRAEKIKELQEQYRCLLAGESYSGVGSMGEDIFTPQGYVNINDSAVLLNEGDVVVEFNDRALMVGDLKFIRDAAYFIGADGIVSDLQPGGA